MIRRTLYTLLLLAAGVASALAQTNPGVMATGTRTAGDCVKWVSAQVITGAGGVCTVSLTNGHIFVGNASNVATDVAMSGEVTINNTGVTTVTRSTIFVWTGLHTFTNAAGIAIGTNVSPPTDAILTANTNAVALPNTSGGGEKWLVNVGAVDASTTVMGVNSFGALSALVLQRANGTNAVKTGLVANDIAGVLSAHGYTNGGAYSGGFVQIRFVATETFTPTTNGGEIQFLTILNGTGPTPTTKRMTVTNAGDILVNIDTAPSLGDTSAGKRLTIQGTSAYGFFQLVNDSVGTNAVMGRITFGSPTYSGSDKRTAVIQSVSTTAATDNPSGILQIFTANVGVVSEALRVYSSGSVGIGTFTDPGAPGILNVLTQIGVPKIIGGSATTGTLLTFQTTIGNGTTDTFAWVGGNNGASAWMTLAATGLNIASLRSIISGSQTMASASTGVFEITQTVTASADSVALIRARPTIGGTAGGASNQMLGLDMFPTCAPTASIAGCSNQFGLFLAPPTTVTIAAARAASAILIYTNVAGAVTLGSTFLVNGPLIQGSLIPTTHRGLDVANQGATGIPTSTAVNIANQSGSTTNNSLVVGTGLTSFADNLIISAATKTLILKQGANGTVGTFVCTGGGTITITNSNVAISDNIIISLNTAGGTITTPPAMKVITAATSFQVLCGATDTSTYNYGILKNAA